MNKCDVIKKEYSKSMNTKKDFCHSIDIENYKILCEDFFLKKSNIDLYISLAEHSVLLNNEAEDEFLNWLKLE